MSFLTTLTAASAWPLAFGLCGEVIRCSTPHRAKKRLRVEEANWGPPSVLSTTGTPVSENMGRKRLINWAADADPGQEDTLGHPERRST